MVLRASLRRTLRNGASRRDRARRPRNERGAFLIIAAISMVAMLAMAAVAIDLSNARQQRRLAQGSADAAALAGAQDLPNSAKVVATVKRYALDNFGTPASAWAGCTDPDRLPELPESGNQCISIDEAFGQVRVRMPERAVETFFAGVVGVDTIDVSAAATAQARLRKDDRIIPATVAASTGSGHICIESDGAGSNLPPCEKSTTGNFGSFNAPRINIYKPTSQEENNALRINYSMGVDHVLSIWGTGSTRVCDFAHPIKSPCTTHNVASGLDANHLLPFTGNAVPPLTDGLVDNATISTDSGNHLFCGRLRRPDLTSSNLSQTDPDNCMYWANPANTPRLEVVGEWINGRHAAYWMKSEYRTLFYGTLNPNTRNSEDPAWRTRPSPTVLSGDEKLSCFLSTYRFDYPAQQEFFVNPDLAIDSNTAEATKFGTPEEARAFLKTRCQIDPAVVDAKVGGGGRFWPMFSKDAIADPRFGMIPVVKQFNSGGSEPMQIVRFWATYTYRLHGSNTQVKAVDAWVFEPALIETESGIADLQFGYQTNEPVVNLVR
jgi:hypothetical protein